MLEEMKELAKTTGPAPDVFTYTTVMAGVARAEVRDKVFLLFFCFWLVLLSLWFVVHGVESVSNTPRGM